MHQPVRHVADINELNRVGGLPGHDHGAAQRGAHRPVNKASRGVARTDHEAGADIRDPPGQGGFGRLLAEGFAPAIIGRVLPHVLRGRVRQRAERGGFIRVRHAGVAIHRDARNKDVLLDIGGQQFRRSLDHAREIAAGVNHRIPFPAGELRQALGAVRILWRARFALGLAVVRGLVRVAIAVQLLDAGGNQRGTACVLPAFLRAAAVEMSDGVAARQGGFGARRPEKTGAPQNQDALWLGGPCARIRRLEHSRQDGRGGQCRGGCGDEFAAGGSHKQSGI